MVCFGEDALCLLSLTAWDRFAFPEDQEHWCEDYLSYLPRNELNVGARMPGLWLIIRSSEGQYEGCTCVLLYEGWMLTYDPASNLSEWVPIQGVSSMLMAAEHKPAYDLSNIILCPCLGAKLQSSRSARPLQSAGSREGCGSVVRTNQGHSEEWDNDDKQADWSCYPSPLLEGAVGEYGVTSGQETMATCDLSDEDEDRGW